MRRRQFLQPRSCRGYSGRFGDYFPGLHRTRLRIGLLSLLPSPLDRQNLRIPLKLLRLRKVTYYNRSRAHNRNRGGRAGRACGSCATQAWNRRHLRDATSGRTPRPIAQARQVRRRARRPEGRDRGWASFLIATAQRSGSAAREREAAFGPTVRSYEAPVGCDGT